MTELSALTRRRFHGLALGAGAAAVGAAALLRPAHAQTRSVEAMMQDRVLGDPTAPVAIYEYSSLSCPHCRAFHQDVLPRIKSAYIEPGRAKLIYRDFPLNGPAVAASMLVRCAPEERFYPLLETLFAQQPEWSTSQDVLGALAQIGRFAGLSADEIDACFQNEALFGALRDSRNAYADEFEISSTPTFIIGDEKIVGAQPFETFADAIEAEAT